MWPPLWWAPPLLLLCTWKKFSLHLLSWGMVVWCSDAHSLRKEPYSMPMSLKPGAWVVTEGQSWASFPFGPRMSPHHSGATYCSLTKASYCFVGPTRMSPSFGLLGECAWVLSRFNHVRLFVTLWTVACQAALSMGFSRQEYWSRLPFPTPGDLPDPGIEPTSLVSSALAGGFFTTVPPGKPFIILQYYFLFL